MIMNLNEFLNKNDSWLVYLINTTEDCYPLLDFILNQLQLRLNTTVKHRFNIDRYFKFKEIEQYLNTGSLFSDNITIEINYKNKPTLEHQQQLSKIIDKLDKNATLIITCDKLNKKDHSLEWVKLISNKGCIINLTSNDLTTIIKYQLQVANLTINRNAINLLEQLNQGNVSQLLQIVNHLVILYPQGYEINEHDIQTHSTDNSQYNIYQLSNAYLHANLTQAVKILDQIYQKTEDAILIQWMVTDDIRKLIKIKGRLQQKQSLTQIFEELRIWSNVVEAWRNTVHRLDYSLLLNILDQLSILDLMVKGIEKGDVKQYIIQIIIQLCKKG